ncbi:MAG: hypothetical protein KAX13_01190 [Candidatus Krumholzibacteria bacterium]|nr:hypothetical protein [Candidatus Krumholzibacteria bacterium]
MKKYIGYCIVSIMAMAFTSVAVSGGYPSSKAKLEAEEYEIMSALINEYAGSDFELLLINDHTESWCIMARFQEMRSDWVELESETIDSLIVRNSFSVELEKKLLLDSKYRLIPRDEYVKILQGNSGPNWNNFDTLFPDSPGFMTVSRVGFNSERTQALIYFYNAYRCSGDKVVPSTRNIAMFVKRDGEWALIGIKRGFRSVYSD